MASFGRISDAESREDGGEFIVCENPQCECTTRLIFPCMEDVKPILTEIWNSRVAFLAPPIADAEVERVATWLEKTHRPNTRTRSIAAVLRRLSTENDRMQVDALIFSKYVRDLIDAGINVPISVHAAAERAKNL